MKEEKTGEKEFKKTNRKHPIFSWNNYPLQFLRFRGHILSKFFFSSRLFIYRLLEKTITTSFKSFFKKNYSNNLISMSPKHNIMDQCQVLYIFDNLGNYQYLSSFNKPGYIHNKEDIGGIFYH